MQRPIDILLSLDGAAPTLNGGGGRIAGVVLASLTNQPAPGIQIALAKRGQALFGASLHNYVKEFQARTSRKWAPVTRDDLKDPLLMLRIIKGALQHGWSMTSLSAGRRSALYAAKRRQGFRACSEWLDQMRPDSLAVVHSHNAFGILGAADRKAADAFGKRLRLATTFHTKGSIIQELPEEARELIGALVLAGEAAAIRVSDVVTFPSQGAAALMLRDHPTLQSARVKVIYNGIEAARVGEAADRARTAARPRPFTVINVAAHERQKNIPVILQAVKELRASGECRLIQIGGGPLTAKLKQQAADLGIADAVRWMGQIPNPEVIRLIAASDVYAVASENVVFDLSTLEAMAAGVAIVATRDGGNLECLGDGEDALLVDVGQVSDMASAIGLLRSNSSRAVDMAGTARRRALRQFTTEEMVRGYVQLYRELDDQWIPEAGASRDRKAMCRATVMSLVAPGRRR